MKIRFEAELVEAVQFTVKLPDGVHAYAEQFLIIVNSAREYPRDFYDVKNSSGNDVYVTCPKENRDSIKEFLEWRGEVTAEHKVYVCRPDYVYSKATSDMLDDVFKDGSDVWEIVTLAPEELY